MGAHAELLEGCKALQTETQTSDEKMQAMHQANSRLETVNTELHQLLQIEQGQVSRLETERLQQAALATEHATATQTVQALLAEAELQTMRLRADAEKEASQVKFQAQQEVDLMKESVEQDSKRLAAELKASAEEELPHLKLKAKKQAAIARATAEADYNQQLEQGLAQAQQ